MTSSGKLVRLEQSYSSIYKSAYGTKGMYSPSMISMSSLALYGMATRWLGGANTTIF